MGLTIGNIGAAARGGAQGYLGKKKDNRMQRKSDQAQQQYDLEMQQRMQHAQKEAAVGRAEVDDVALIPQAPQEIAGPGQAPGAIPNAPQPAGGPPQGSVTTDPSITGGIGGMPSANGMMAAAEGGLAQVGPPLPGALPEQEGPPAPQPVAQAPAPQAAKPSRRDRYKEWYGKARSAAVMAGGLDGLKLFEDQENALSRKQMLGYGMDGVAAMRDGNAGEAVKQLNTMLEVSPQDTGMKWEAHNGQVFMVGPDNKRGKAYNQDAVMALIENKIKTPENYLEFQEESRLQGTADEAVRAAGVEEAMDVRKQTETERAAGVNEGIDQQVVDVAGRNADTNAQNANTNTEIMGIAKTRQPAQTLLDRATAYYRLAAGKAAMEGAGGTGGPSDWWGKRNLGDIEAMEEDAKKGQLGFAVDSPWLKEDVINTELFNSVMNSMKLIRMGNEPTSMTDNGAAELARMAYFIDLELGEGVDISSVIPPSLAKTKVFQDKDTGAWEVEYQGKRYSVPPEVGIRIHLNRQHLPALPED